MAEVVDPKEIEYLVGTKRHETEHYLRIATNDNEGREPGTIYILHSHECVRRLRGDLLDCDFTRSMDKGGVRPKDWDDLLDRPVMIRLTSKYYIKPKIPEPYVYKEG